MTNVVKLHNKALYRVHLDVTQRYTVYIEAVNERGIDEEVKHVVDSDMYQFATDHKPIVMSYSYSADYITCEKSFDEFAREQEDN